MTSRPARLAALFAALAIVVVPSAASAGSCAISISPSQGQFAGGPITVNGSGWTQNDAVYLNIGGVQVFSDAIPDGNGNFSKNASVPNGLSVGSHNTFASSNQAICEVHGSYNVIQRQEETTTTAAPETTTTTTAATTTTTTTLAPVTTEVVEETIVTTPPVESSGDDSINPIFLVLLGAVLGGGLLAAGMYFGRRSG
jgi:hypothetical protein